MSNLLLGVTGSVAAVRTPELVRTFESAGHAVRVVASEPSLYFFERSNLHETPLFRDVDEWPGARYERGQPVLHIELRKWAEIYVVAPLDAHTLGRFALGLSDNLVSSVFRAWDFSRPVVLAPAMNTLMWESPVTRRQLGLILEDRGDGQQPKDWTLADVSEIFARHAPGIVLVPPQSKRLACGDTAPARWPKSFKSPRR